MNNINWFPGHMNKARRLIEDSVKHVDLVIEIRDARIPFSSHNPLLDKIINNKKRLIVLNKKDLADHNITILWLEELRKDNTSALAIDCTRDNVRNILVNAIKENCDDILQRAKRRGILKKVLKVMVVGIPNVGKSTMINKIVKKNVAKTENRPGVTKNINWIRIHDEIDLLDTPGVLWPSFENETIGKNLALIGSINKNVVDKENLCKYALNFLIDNYPYKLSDRYGIDDINKNVEELLIDIANKKLLFMKDQMIDYQRLYDLILTDFKNDKFSGVSIERP